MADQSQSVIETERVENLACIECSHVMDVSYLPSFASIKCPACGVQQTVPAKFGSFLLLSRLGAGGMGVIYHAVDRELGRHVALKVMKRSLGDDEEFSKSFKHEAQAAATLNHRHVVQIYSFGQVAGQPYIVMELVDGGRLDEMIANGPLAETRALEIHLEVTEGLNAASQVGLVHGDIKPANILFGQGGEAKVVDFGLASFIGQQQQQTGQVWGTPYYIAPEKARGKKVDFRSDIYSLGATLFHVLVGQPPFDGATPVDVVMARLKQPAPNVLSQCADLRPQTADLVARMLEAEPTMRYPSYPALLVDMRAALDACRALQKKVGPSSGTFAGPRKRKFEVLRKLPWKTILMTTLVVGALGAAGYWGLQEHKKRIQAAQAMEAKVAWQLVLDHGRNIKGQVDGVAQAMADTAEDLLLMEQKANHLAEVISETAPPMAALREAADRAQAAMNSADDTRSLAYLIYRELAATSNARAAQTRVDRMETLFRDLSNQQNALNKVKRWAAESLKAATVQYNSVLEADEALRRQAVEAAARARQAEADRQRAIQEKSEAQRRRLITVQRELDRLDEARAANAPLILRRQFDEAGKAIAGLQANLTQPESKAYFQALGDAYRDMDQLKVFLVKSIRAAPCLRGWVDGNDDERDIVNADIEEGIKIALGPYGNMQVTWDKVGIPQWLKIVQYYINDPKMSKKQRAEILLGVALFCYESGDFKQAEKIVAAAYNQDPSIKGEVRRLMPGF